MKKLIFALIIAASFASCSTANADIIIKYGMVVSDHQEENTLTWAGIWGETNNCDYCVALFALETYGESNDQPRDQLLGADYVVKVVENTDGVIRTNLGFAVADEGLQGGEVFNFHFGASMALKGIVFGQDLMLSYDHFSNGRTLFDRDHILVNEPLDLMSLGIVF